MWPTRARPGRHVLGQEKGGGAGADVPPEGDPEAPLQALVTNLDASAFLGRLALIRIYKGRIRKGQQVAWMRDGSLKKAW